MEADSDKKIRRRAVKTRSRFTTLLTVYFFVTLIVPNLVLANTEPYSLWTVEALILMPLGFYMMWSVALRRSGVMIWLAFPFIFFCAFQIVLLYLFGNSVIATDMFTNVLTTNPGEAGELLGNIYPAVVLVCPAAAVARGPGDRPQTLHFAHDAAERRADRRGDLRSRNAGPLARLPRERGPARAARRNLPAERLLQPRTERLGVP